MIEIVKYPNRRLYGPNPDPESKGKKTYLGLDDVIRFVRRGEEVRVREKAKGHRRQKDAEIIAGPDITIEILIEAAQLQHLRSPVFTARELLAVIRR